MSEGIHPDARKLVSAVPGYSEYAWKGAFYCELMDREDVIILENNYPTSSDILAVWDVLRPKGERYDLFQHIDGDEYRYVMRVQDVLISVYYRTTGDILYLMVAGSQSDDNVFQFRDLIAGCLKGVKTPPDDKIKVNFTYDTNQGAEIRAREIEACAWKDIKRNYASKTQSELQWLFDLGPESLTGGKLAVLYGPPGTGKTHLIRSLAREWKEWASISYIVDVDRFFANSGYMFDILTASNSKKWRIIVCEDAEEYIAPEAKAKVGQALSRLLNVGDGMVGQGLNVMILFSTNAEKTNLHKAITRAGRCFAKIEVPALSPTEATDWMGGTPIFESTVLSDLYERKNKTKVETEEVIHTTGAYL